MLPVGKPLSLGSRWGWDGASLKTVSAFSHDPIGYRGGINLYEYCGDGPVNAVDPEGLLFHFFPYNPVSGHLTQLGGILWLLGGGLNALEKACETCHPKKEKTELPGLPGCPEPTPDNPKNCTADQCKKEARKIIDALVEVWMRYYGTDDTSQKVGGHWCYDWMDELYKALEASATLFQVQ